MMLDHPRSIGLFDNSLLISLNIPRKALHTPTIAHPQVSAHVTEHSNIVRDHEHTSTEIPQRVRECVHGFYVQVIGRLVEDEDVRVGQREAGECHTRLLTSGEEGHLLEACCPGYAEGTKMAAVLFIGSTWEHLCAEGYCARVQVEGIDVVLGEEANSEAGVLGDTRDSVRPFFLYKIRVDRGLTARLTGRAAQ